MATNGGGNSAIVQSDQRLLEILGGLQALNGAGVTELATHLGLPKSTVFNHLATLHKAEYVTKTAGQYHLGLRFLDLGENARQHRMESQQIRSKLTEIADQTGERAQFIVEEHGRGVYLYRATGRNAVATDSQIGKYLSLHASSAGKAILAHLPEDRLEPILAAGFEQYTAHTITDVDALQAELETIREQGYAVNKEENIDRLRAVGAPILGPDDTVLGAISVSGPSHRLTGDRFTAELPALIKGITNEIELNIAFS